MRKERATFFMPKRRPKSRAPPAPVDIDDETEDDRMIEHVLNGGTLDHLEPEVFDRLIAKLKDDRDEMILNNMLDESEMANEAAERMAEMQNRSMKATFQQSQRADIEERLEHARQDYKSMLAMCKEQERQYLEMLEDQIADMKERHSEDIAALEEEWRSPAKLRMYNRTSGQLRNMRTQQIKLLNAHRYEEMRILERTANELEKRETRAMQRQMVDDYATVLEAMKERQAAEIRQAESVNEQRIETLRKQTKKSLDVLMKRIVKLERALGLTDNCDVIWNIKRHNEFTATIPPSQKSVAARMIIRKGKPIDVFEFNTLKLQPVPEAKGVTRRSLRRSGRL